MNKTIGITTVIAVAGAFTLLAATDARADHSPTTTIKSVVINGGKPVVVGATETTKFSVVITAKDSNGIFTGPVGDGGSDTDITKEPSSSGGLAWGNDDFACVNTSGTTWKCTETYTLSTLTTFAGSSLAGTWGVEYDVIAKNLDSGTDPIQDPDVLFKLLKRAKLAAADATPEPVKKNATLTITSKLTRANWATGKYGAYAGQKVKLQFEKAGTSSWATVKTISSSSTGALKATTAATVDGTYRYVYAGNATTSSVASAGDYVDVR